jgi:hypothetical protein
MHHSEPLSSCDIPLRVLRRCLWLICALTSCAPTTREGWRGAVSQRSEGLCWWRNARWEDRAPLLVRGTGQAFAHARARWAGELWRGTSATAVLRRSGPLVMLQGEWIGPGLTLTADVDVTGAAVFRAYEPKRLGSAGVLLKGGHVRVLDAVIGHALVVPADDALAAFQSTETVGLEVGCDALSLSAIPEGPGDPARRQLAATGFKADAPERWVPQKAQLPLSAKFAGPTVGLVGSEKSALRGFVVEQKEGEARLVVPTATGVVWVGWVNEAGLAPQQESASDQAASPLAPVETAGRPVAGEWRSCERDELEVSIELDEKFIQVGSLHPGASFSILASRGEYREVALAVEWLDVNPDVRLLLPARAIDCPRSKQLGAW